MREKTIPTTKFMAKNTSKSKPLRKCFVFKLVIVHLRTIFSFLMMSLFLLKPYLSPEEEREEQLEKGSVLMPNQIKIESFNDNVK